jgi:hypothetical protein
VIRRESNPSSKRCVISGVVFYLTRSCFVPDALLVSLSALIKMFIPALIANWKVWPAVQTINFRYMPLRYRVPFTGAVGIAWQVFLSILNAAKKDTSSETLVVT